MKIENFSYSYQYKNIFSGANFYIADNEMNFILGENGVGKSTLLDCIANVDGSRTKEFIGFPKPQRIGYLSQGNNFENDLTVADILGFMKQVHDVREFKLPSVIQKFYQTRFGSLSGGERRILLVFINTILDKGLYIFDEPEAGIDGKHAVEMFSWLRGLSDIGKTLIVTTHQLDNIRDTDNVNYICNEENILVGDFVKVKNKLNF